MRISTFLCVIFAGLVACSSSSNAPPIDSGTGTTADATAVGDGRVPGDSGLDGTSQCMLADACSPGETRAAPEGSCGPGISGEQTCSAQCTWADPVCNDACGGTARTEPELASEVCIPAGTFVRGDEMFDDAVPVAEVYVSAFYMDRYPVTNERYWECLTNGGCTDIDDAEGRAWLRDADRLHFPVQGITAEQAQAFCDWDGGRTVPTEAEWEKSARGPAPNWSPFIWGDTYDCSRLASAACGFAESVEQQLPDPVDGLPGTRSIYGVEMLIGGGLEWVSDSYIPDYYESPESLTDPQAFVSGWTVVRGAPRFLSDESLFRIGRRHIAPLTPTTLHVFRCNRRSWM